MISGSKMISFETAVLNNSRVRNINPFEGLNCCLLNLFHRSSLCKQKTINTLFSDFLKQSQPSEGFLMWGLVVVLVTLTLWLVLATYLDLPVSSQQSTQGALLGTMLLAEGFNYSCRTSYMQLTKNENHNFNRGGLLWIFLEWTVAPLVAFVIAYLFFVVLKTSLLRHENAEKGVLVFLPIDYGISSGLLCLFIMSEVLGNFINVNVLAATVAVVAATLIGAILSLFVVVPLAMKKLDAAKTYKSTTNENTLNNECLEKNQEPQEQYGDLKMDEEDVEEILRDFMQMRVQSVPESATTKDQSTPFNQVLGSSPNMLVQRRNCQRMEKPRPFENVVKFIRDITKSTIHPVIEYDRHTLIRHVLAEKYDEMEDCFSYPQILASCTFACLGGKLTYISNSRGLMARLATVAAMIMVSRIKLPVSSIHAFIGLLVGVGMADDVRNVNWKLVGKYLCGWVMTIVFCCGVAHVMFSASIHTPAYVMP
ncbi:hypothetical protein SLEP1_g6129 [Rubroshorea leprosula]|uniref:Phosphate transporter n=1 Tax=Rubroshorea leprosula TaxID=152421 RepID=A0AAV5HYM4_9ROSI|nr:hypothetical protein SLEP1_g6129 [Rubroshorea leprosula]